MHTPTYGYQPIVAEAFANLLYLLTEILEEMLTDDELKPELAIFTAYYEDYQTKVYQLTDEEMISARADGLDFFLNLRRFVPERE
jgi:hypothetical protein